MIGLVRNGNIDDFGSSNEIHVILEVIQDTAIFDISLPTNNTATQSCWTCAESVELSKAFGNSPTSDIHMCG
jgi:hypothetical protein